MYLIITLRKEVPDEATGQVLFEIVKQRMADKPDVKVSGNVTSRLDLEPETP